MEYFDCHKPTVGQKNPGVAMKKRTHFSFVDGKLSVKTIPKVTEL